MTDRKDSRRVTGSLTDEAIRALRELMRAWDATAYKPTDRLTEALIEADRVLTEWDSR